MPSQDCKYVITRLDGGRWVMRSGQAHTLPVPALPATPCALLREDDGSLRSPATGWVPLGQVVSLRVVVNRIPKNTPRPEKFRPGRVEMGESRTPRMAFATVRHCRIFLGFCPFAVRRCSPMFARVGGRIGGKCAKHPITDQRERSCPRGGSVAASVLRYRLLRRPLAPWHGYSHL
jgi:hypothetical protein